MHFLNDKIIIIILQEFGFKSHVLNYTKDHHKIITPFSSNVMYYRQEHIDSFTGLIRDRFGREIYLNLNNGIISARYTRFLEPVINHDALFCQISFNLCKPDSLYKFETFLNREDDDLLNESY